MKMMIIKTMISISIVSTMTKSPMSMSLMLLTQTSLTIVMMNTNNSSSWVPLITFLTMIGGLMIIFMYMSSITSNEKLKMNLKMILPIIIMMMITEEMMMNWPNHEIQLIHNSMNNMMSVNKLYNKSMMMTMMMILYLLLTMISINKIIKLFEGPLRSNTYE
uniref:NADH dehydrogenase subunit 6 n=1 Tax=Tricentrus longivalvulatus TaxID=2913657 RepID=UPI001EDFCC0D|nr:NADH dehydrogenase subunit 6 [Tricentrus longivalvulatus]UKB86932.1 NADH dehydrogenase subunit 6 [Tricentrus longivalvulatus]